MESDAACLLLFGSRLGLIWMCRIPFIRLFPGRDEHVPTGMTYFSVQVGAC